MLQNQKLKKFLCAFISMLMVVSTINVVSASNAEIKGHWAENQLSDWVDRGLVTGYLDGTYKPNNKITRSEFIALVNRAYQFDEKGEVEFTDISSEANAWLYGEVAKAKKAGYINGFVDGSFRPNNNITRQEVAAIISRLDKLEPNSDVEALKKFKDANEIPNWSKADIGAVVEKGYMKGTPENKFKALAEITRAEVVTALDRVVTKEIAATDAKPLFDAIRKQQDIKTMESKSSLNFTLDAKDLTEENQAAFDEIANILNNAEIDVESKFIVNDEGGKATGETNFSTKAKGVNVGTTIWMDMDMSGDTGKFTEIIKIPEILADFMPEELQNKDYLIIDDSQESSQPVVGNPKELIEMGKKLQDIIMIITEKNIDKVNTDFSVIKDRGIKIINTAEGKDYAKIYQVRLDDATLKAVIKESVNDMAQDKDFVNLIREYILAMAAQETNVEVKAELEKIAAELEENPEAFVERFNKVMDILEDVTLIGERGIAIDYAVSNEGYIISQKGNIDFIIDLVKLSKAFDEIAGKTLTEDETISGVLSIGIEFDTDIFNINGDVKIEMPELTTENSMTMEELMEAFAKQEDQEGVIEEQ